MRFENFYNSFQKAILDLLRHRHSIQFNTRTKKKKILEIVTRGDYTFLGMCEKVEQQIVQLVEKIKLTENLLEQTDMCILNKWLLDIRKEELKTIVF